MRQRGMTLPEVLVAAAVSVLMAAALFSAAGGSRPLALRASLAQLDAAVAYARTLAATSGNGSTLLFEPAARGWSAVVYRGRPTAPGAMTPGGVPPFPIGADLREAALGAPPFSVFFDSAGHAGAQPGALASGAVLAADPGCPAGGTVTLLVSVGGAQDRRTFACKPPFP